jgi:hypothetical protein
MNPLPPLEDKGVGTKVFHMIGVVHRPQWRRPPCLLWPHSSSVSPRISQQGMLVIVGSAAQRWLTSDPTTSVAQVGSKYTGSAPVPHL